MTMEGITGMALAPGSAALSSSAFSRQRWQQAIVLKTFPHSLPLHAFQSVLVGPANAQTWRQRGRRGDTCYVPARAVLANDSPSASANSDLVVPDKSVSVILLAGGKGKRMGANMPKQYLPLLGQPIALHSFFTFAGMVEVKEVVVVCDPSYRDIFEEAGKDITVTLKFALPGKERQDSVESGLKEISPGSRLACVHDSARPLVLTSDIKKVLGDAFIHGAAVLGVPVKATIKEATEKQFVAKTLDRRTLWEMHTPQVIEPSLLRRGFELVKEKSLEVTDDVSIVEYLNHPVYITQGSYTNLKVTTPDDLIVAERILHGERSKVAAR